MRQIIQRLNNQTTFISIAILFSVWGIVLRVFKLAGRNLWNDEIYQMDMTKGAFKPIWERHTYGDMTCFPGDYLITYPFVQMFQPNKWLMAIPHMVMTVVGFYLLYRLCQKYFKTFLGFIVTFSIICFNQYLIFHAFELRPYAVLPTLMIGSIYFTSILFDDYDALSRWKKAGLTLFYLYTILFHAFGILIVGFPVMYFLLDRWRKPELAGTRRRLLGYFLGLLCIALPLWFWYALGNPLQFTKERFVQSNINPFDSIWNPLDNFKRFFNYVVFYYLIGFKRLYFYLGGLILFIFVPYKGKLTRLGFFFVMIIIPLQLILLAALYKNYWFLTRQFIYLSPCLAFFLGWIWDSAARYYLEEGHYPLRMRTIFGLVLMLGCVTAGIIGILINLKL